MIVQKVAPTIQLVVIHLDNEQQMGSGFSQHLADTFWVHAWVVPSLQQTKWCARGRHQNYPRVFFLDELERGMFYHTMVESVYPFLNDSAVSFNPICYCHVLTVADRAAKACRHPSMPPSTNVYTAFLSHTLLTHIAAVWRFRADRPRKRYNVIYDPCCPAYRYDH